MSSECRGYWGELFGHCFKARYSEKITPPDPKVVGELKTTVGGARMFLDKMTARDSIYECDVCVRCGEVTKKPQ